MVSFNKVRNMFPIALNFEYKEDPIFDSVEKNIVGLAFYENTVEFKIGHRLVGFIHS